MHRIRSVRGLTAIKARAAPVIENVGWQRSTLARFLVLPEETKKQLESLREFKC
jgi:hypothetical protein